MGLLLLWYCNCIENKPEKNFERQINFGFTPNQICSMKIVIETEGKIHSLFENMYIYSYLGLSPIEC